MGSKSLGTPVVRIAAGRCANHDGFVRSKVGADAGCRLMREFAVFLREAMRGKSICAVVPSSLATVRRVCKEIPTDRPVTVLEYGPGTGVFTRYLAQRLHPESTILAIELHEGFYREMCRWRDRTATGARALIEHASCTDVLNLLERHSLPPADFALSGIPLSTFSEDLRSEILDKTYAALRPGGTFYVYQYSFFMHERLRNVFDSVDRDFSFFNLPPTAIMRARKSAGAVIPSAKVTGNGSAFPSSTMRYQDAGTA